MLYCVFVSFRDENKVIIIILLLLLKFMGDLFCDEIVFDASN